MQHWVLLVGKPAVVGPVVGQMCLWEQVDVIKWSRVLCVDWIDLAKDGDQWRIVTITVMHFVVP
jgi:hypothetical protein